MLRVIFLALVLFASQGYAQDDTSPKSNYVPMCFETHKGDCRSRKNMVIILGSTGLVPTFSAGYFRVVTPDLAFGFTIDGNTNTGITGWKFGFGYLFGN